MRFQTRIFLTVICVALVPIILCFTLLLPVMVSTSTKRQSEAAQASLARFQAAMNEANDTRTITTEIATAKPFYYAEDDHQQYLHKNPYGYCGIGGIGVCLPPQA